MDLRYTREENAFRQEVRAWLRSAQPQRILQKMQLEQLHAREDLLEWHRILEDKGWLVPQWPKEYGGQGWNAVQFFIWNEELLRTPALPPLAHVNQVGSVIIAFGSDEQKAKYLEPLLDGRISSCYSMTEPQGGADPGVFKCSAVRDGDEWVIDGEKWFASSLRYATFLIVMVITDPDVVVHKGASMFLVPADSPGIEVVRNVGVGQEAEGHGGHAYVRYNSVRVPVENLLGGEGQAFTIAQTRLGGGRLHHAMRTVGAVSRCLDMLCERALSRTTQGELLARKQATQEKIADSFIELLQFKLQVLHAAWVVDQKGGHAARKEIAAVKVATPKVYREAVLRTMQLHGALGVSNEMPLANMLMASVTMGIADGPTEVHKFTVAREVLKDYSPAEGDWPSEHLPERRAAARAEFADLLERSVSDH